MRKWMILMLGGLFLLTASTAFTAGDAKKMEKAEKKAEKTTIEGTLVDLKCYLEMGASGEKHASCAAKCAKSGLPMGVLKSGTSEVYNLLVASPAVADYGEQTIRVTGTVMGHALSPEKMEVQKDGRWEEVKLPGMM